MNTLFLHLKYTPPMWHYSLGLFWSFHLINQLSFILFSRRTRYPSQYPHHHRDLQSPPPLNPSQKLTTSPPSRSKPDPNSKPTRIQHSHHSSTTSTQNGGDNPSMKSKPSLSFISVISRLFGFWRRRRSRILIWLWWIEREREREREGEKREKENERLKDGSRFFLGQISSSQHCCGCWISSSYHLFLY